MLCCVNGLQREKATLMVRINICLVRNNAANDVYYVYMLKIFLLDSIIYASYSIFFTCVQKTHFCFN